MNRRETVLALLALGAVPIALRAQQAGKLYLGRNITWWPGVS